MSNDNNSSLPEAPLNETWEEFYETAPCGYLSTSVDGRVIKCNRTLLIWLGYGEAESIGGKRFVDLLSAGGKIFYDTHLSLLLRVQPSVNQIALDLVRKDGTLLPTIINAKQKRNMAGQPALNSFTIFDSTERRLYERQLLAARDLFHTILSSIGDGVVSTDASGLVTFMNPIAEELSGWTENDAIGNPVEEVLVLIREDTKAKIENPVVHALRTRETVGPENHTVLIAKDGRLTTIDDNAAPIRDADGAIVGAVLVFRDVSSRRESEKALAGSHRLLERYAAELRRSNEDLSQFAYVASHDLRSPLNTVMQMTQLIEKKYGAQMQGSAELLNFVRRATRRMADLIDDLLTYAKVSHIADPNRGPVDANVHLQYAIENLKSAANPAGAIITQDALPKVLVDGTNLVQLFQNLIGNAIRYRSSAPPEIHITAEQDGRMQLFSCKDNGVGIGQEFLSAIFEPFKRLHGTEVPGSGLGLAVCRKIVERYGGRIWVESAPGQGSTFRFTLPGDSDAL